MNQILFSLLHVLSKCSPLFSFMLFYLRLAKKVKLWPSWRHSHVSHQPTDALMSEIKSTNILLSVHNLLFHTRLEVFELQPLKKTSQKWDSGHEWVNDMPDVLDCMVKIFADDTKAYSAVSTPEQRQQLQNNIDRLLQWTDLWQINPRSTSWVQSRRKML